MTTSHDSSKDDAELREQLEGLASAASVFGEDNPRTTRRIDALLQLIKARDAAKEWEARMEGAVDVLGGIIQLNAMLRQEPTTAQLHKYKDDCSVELSKLRTSDLVRPKELQIGDRVVHDFSRTPGVVTGKRLKEPYRYQVLWDGDHFKQDWYKREVLVKVEEQ